jgi:hypothetical protein
VGWADGVVFAATADDDFSAWGNAGGDVLGSRQDRPAAPHGAMGADQDSQHRRHQLYRRLSTRQGSWR